MEYSPLLWSTMLVLFFVALRRVLGAKRSQSDERGFDIFLIVAALAGFYVGDLVRGLFDIWRVQVSGEWFDWIGAGLAAVTVLGVANRNAPHDQSAAPNASGERTIASQVAGRGVFWAAIVLTMSLQVGSYLKTAGNNPGFISELSIGTQTAFGRIDGLEYLGEDTQVVYLGFDPGYQTSGVSTYRMRWWRDGEVVLVQEFQSSGGYAIIPVETAGLVGRGLQNGHYVISIETTRDFVARGSIEVK